MSELQVSNSDRLLSCFPEWKNLTFDKWVLETVQGYKIIFDDLPCQRKIPNKIKFLDSEKLIIDKEVEKMLHEGAIKYSHHKDGEFLSNIFLVLKPNEEYRPILNLKKLNEFVHYDKFKQETFSFVLELVKPNDFFTSLDLRKAYWSIPIHESFL